MTETFDDLGIRFEYPAEWELEVTEDGAITTVSIQSPSGPAFALVTIDESCPAPIEVIEAALEAMREEYPGLDSTPAREMIDGHPAIGHDVEFFSLDMTSGCIIRCFRTERRTVLVFGQWSDIEDEATCAALAAMRKSLEETDAE